MISIIDCATISRGYRMPSLDAQPLFSIDEATIAKAESVLSYEIGLKTRLIDRKVRSDTSAFYHGCSDQQFINLNPVTRVQLLGRHIDFKASNRLRTAAIWGKNLANRTWFAFRLDLLDPYGIRLER